GGHRFENHLQHAHHAVTSCNSLCCLFRYFPQPVGRSDALSRGRCARRDWFRRGIHHGSSDQCQGRQQQHPHGHPKFPHHHSHAPGADKSIKKRHGRTGTQRKLRRIGGTRCHQHHHGCDRSEEHTSELQS